MATSDNAAAGVAGDRELGPLLGAMLQGESEAEAATALRRARWALFGARSDEEAEHAEDLLRSQQPKMGACPRQWGAQDIAFRCLQCESDSCCCQCVECFFAADHTGHQVQVLRTTGGSCDCGDPTSWDPKGFCPAHSETAPHFDGPESLNLLPEAVRSIAEKLLPVVVEALDAILQRMAATPLPAHAAETEAAAAGLDLDRRAAAILKFLGRLAEMSFGLRHLICRELRPERLHLWLDSHLAAHRSAERASSEDEDDDDDENERGPRSKQRPSIEALHDFLLLAVQVSPNFKRIFSIVFAQYYGRLHPSPEFKSSPLRGLSVQLFTMSAIALELVAEHKIVEELFGLLRQWLAEIVNGGSSAVPPLVFSAEWPKHAWERLHTLVYDIGYIVAHEHVCRFILGSKQIQSAIVGTLMWMWRMAPQQRRGPREAHVLYENEIWVHLFIMENLLLEKLGPIGDYCRRVSAIEEATGWYAMVMAAIAEAPAVFNTSDSASFHMPLMRLLVRCLNPAHLIEAREGCRVTHEALVRAFPVALVSSSLLHVVRTLRFAAEVRDGRWVRNGEAMRRQEGDYQEFLARLDLAALQYFGALLWLHGFPEPEATSMVCGFRPPDPLLLLWVAVMCDEPPPNGGECGLALDYMVHRWRALLETASDVEDSTAQLRVELFWELLSRSMNEIVLLELAMLRPGVDIETSGKLLQRLLVQQLAFAQPLPLSELRARLPSELRSVSEERLAEALRAVAVARSGGGNSEARPLALADSGWRWYDAFLVLDANIKDRHKAEEAALAKPSAAAPLLGPRRCDGLLSEAAVSIQELLIEAFCHEVLADMVSAFVTLRCAAKLRRGRGAEMLAARCDTAFAHCLKVLDLSYDASCGSSLTARLRRSLHPGPGLPGLGQCAEIISSAGGIANPDAMSLLCTVGPVSLEDGMVEVYVAGSSTDVRRVHPGALRLPLALRTGHDALLDRLRALRDMAGEGQVVKRLMDTDGIFKRLSDRAIEVGIVAREQSSLAATASAGTDSASADRHRKRLDVMKERQRALLMRMQQQQRAAAAMLISDEPEANKTAGDEKDNTCEDVIVEAPVCATCHERASDQQPLSVVAHMAPSNIMRFYGGSNEIVARFTSCGHLVHATCCASHVSSVRRSGVLGSRGYFVDVEKHEFMCPLCRSLANCMLPCISDEFFFSRLTSPMVTAWSSDADAAITLQATESSHWRSSLQSQISRLGLGAANARLLVSSVEELLATCTLFPQRVPDGCLPAPLYETLLRLSFLLRCGEPGTAQDVQVSSLLLASLERNVPRCAVWSLDVRLTLADAVADALSSAEGLTRRTFRELVVALLRLLAAQLLDRAFGNRAPCDAAPDAGEGPLAFVSRVHGVSVLQESVPIADVGRGLSGFLLFASWLCAAIWRWTSKERTCLAYIDVEDARALPQLGALLHLQPDVDAWNLLQQPLLPVLLPGSWARGVAAAPRIGMDPGKLPGLVPFTPLPSDYVDLIRRCYSQRCAACGDKPPEPALCLLCSTIVCMDNPRCRGSSPQEGQCTQHARQCALGQGLFILPFYGMVLAVSAPSCGFWECPYVDGNGETNMYLQRPCLLTYRLDAQRLERLRQIVTTTSIRREIVAHNERTGRYIPRAL